jgi:hypothetical protein
MRLIEPGSNYMSVCFGEFFFGFIGPRARGLVWDVVLGCQKFLCIAIKYYFLFVFVKLYEFVELSKIRGLW